MITVSLPLIGIILAISYVLTNIANYFMDHKEKRSKRSIALLILVCFLGVLQIPVQLWAEKIADDNLISRIAAEISEGIAVGDDELATTLINEISRQSNKSIEDINAIFFGGIPTPTPPVTPTEPPAPTEAPPSHLWDVTYAPGADASGLWCITYRMDTADGELWVVNGYASEEYNPATLKYIYDGQAYIDAERGLLPHGIGSQYYYDSTWKSYVFRSGATFENGKCLTESPPAQQEYSQEGTIATDGKNIHSEPYFFANITPNGAPKPR
jgi:hypothetical protein